MLTGSRRDRSVAVLAAAGIAGPIVFTAVAIVQGLLQPDYSHVALPVSALAAWPLGWIQNVSFVVLAVLMSAYAIGLHRGIRPSRGGAVGPGLLLSSAVGLVIAASFPWKAADGSFVVPAGHLLGAILAFMGAAIGLSVLSRRMAHDPRFRSLAGYVLVSGVTMVVLFLATRALVIPEDAPLNRLGGVVQRVTVAVWFACTIVLALRLWRVARGAQGAPSRTSR